MIKSVWVYGHHSFRENKIYSERGFTFEHHKFNLEHCLTHSNTINKRMRICMFLVVCETKKKVVVRDYVKFILLPELWDKT